MCFVTFSAPSQFGALGFGHSGCEIRDQLCVCGVMPSDVRYICILITTAEENQGWSYLFQS